MRAKAITDTKYVVAASGIRFTKAVLALDSCNDDGTNPYRANVTGFITPAATDADNQAAFNTWVSKLTAAGWARDSGSVTHDGTFLTKNGTRLSLHPSRVGDSSYGNFNLYGPCGRLPHDVAPGDLPPVEDILATVQPTAK